MPRCTPSPALPFIDATMPPNADHRQRAGLLPAPSPACRCWVLVLLVMPLLALAQAAPMVRMRGGLGGVAGAMAVAQLRPQPQPAGAAQVQSSTAAGAEADAPALPAASDIPPAAVPARERGVLFKVTPPATALLPAQQAEAGAAPVTAAPPVSYLLGTIHFGTPEEQGIDYAQLGKLLGASDTFVNEADIDSPWKPDYDAYRWLPVETPLGGMLGKDDMLKAQALLPAVGLKNLQRMKPWAVLALLEARGESGGDATMDARLQRAAAAAGKRLLHLESLEQQLQALDCVPAAEHARVLDERLHASWVLRIESAEAMAYYRSRNLDAWLASIDRMDGLGDAAKAIEQRARVCLLEDRNARWIGPLETAFQDGASFVAVGAIHLVGPQGLIARLRRDGFKVEAMPL